MSASSASLPLCALIVLTYNWPQALRLVLESVKRQSRLPDEVIVVDDGSGAETAALMNALVADFPVPLRHVWQEDLGFRAARCRNLGIAATSAQYVILIDGDMLLHRDFIADHLALARPGRFLQGGGSSISNIFRPIFLFLNGIPPENVH
ncbi:glycosyltransferase [Xanthomonas hortorum]|uniref:glycosyltransferase n=1 Tax=Xanthomonas hortorum TaxID=56454 RepID=UPI002935700F|nr:glycosyltransferase [Xanthomonas hortorum]MDV2453612.1 glycosyltransferase [Xanthomonas hortorum NBC5720]